jgi:Holliday junction resolvase-like predicted endonuclease
VPRVEEAAIEHVKRYLTEQGWTVYAKTDVEGKKWIGYDLMAMRKKEFQFVEVKGTEKEFAIPDMVETEFTRKLTMIATHLYVVGNLNSSKKKPILYVIPRDAFSRDNFAAKRIVHFKRKYNGEFAAKYRSAELNSL